MKKTIVVALAYGIGAFLIWFTLSLIGWQLFPYDGSSQSLTNQFIWLIHVLAEKFGGLIFGCIISVLAARTHHPTWEVGVITAVTSALIFQFTAIIVYIIRWGFIAYWKYNELFSTVFFTLALSILFGVAAVWRQYRREKNAA